MNDWRNDDEILCHCRGVKAGCVRKTVVELRPRKASDVGPVCNAGTGCKSCWPDIETVIEQERRARAARGWWARLVARWRRGGS